MAGFIFLSLDHSLSLGVDLDPAFLGLGLRLIFHFPLIVMSASRLNKLFGLIMHFTNLVSVNENERLTT